MKELNEKLLESEYSPTEEPDCIAKRVAARYLPIGTKIVSLVNEDKIGTVVSYSLTRDIPECTVRWNDGGESTFFSSQDIKNKIKQYTMTELDIAALYSGLPKLTVADCDLVAYERPCSAISNKIGKCLTDCGSTESCNYCICCGSRITPNSDICYELS